MCDRGGGGGLHPAQGKCATLHTYAWQCTAWDRTRPQTSCVILGKSPALSESVTTLSKWQNEDNGCDAFGRCTNRLNA